MKRTLGLLAWATHLGLLASVLVIGPANAYLDPGSGSIIFQAVVGAALAGSLAVKVFWRRIVAFFQRNRS